jgi:hypothetical protein
VSTPLDLAVEIAGTVTRFRGTTAPIDIELIAMEISSRFPASGYSNAEIADALAEEGSRAGVAALRPEPASA